MLSITPEEIEAGEKNILNPELNQSITDLK